MRDLLATQYSLESIIVAGMSSLTLDLRSRTLARIAGIVVLAAFVSAPAVRGFAQDTPLLSGGVGLLTTTNGGNTTYLPIIEPLLAAPLGKHVLVESRAALVESFAPNGGSQPGYNHSHFIGLTYLQGDVVATRHFTLVAGDYLIPFNTYNERLSPIWIGNYLDGPLIAALGTFSSGSGLGGMLRGNAIARNKYSIDYNVFYSTRSGNEQFSAQRASGGRASLYLPEQRLEVGFSYDRLLQGTHENFYGVHAWWEPEDSALRLRSEFGRGEHAQGYWVEADFRMKAFGGLESTIGRLEPVFRIQQTFRRDTTASDGLPLVNTQHADFGLDYNFAHNIRILSSYARQFASTGDRNIWETGLVYRFLFPAWKGKER
jgi:hypothetical protein